MARTVQFKLVEFCKCSKSRLGLQMTNFVQRTGRGGESARQGSNAVAKKHDSNTWSIKKQAKRRTIWVEWRGEAEFGRPLFGNATRASILNLVRLSAIVW